MSAYQRNARSFEEEPPDAPSATGQYPEPVWKNGHHSGNGTAVASSHSTSDDEVPEPPSATGQYPGPVWTNGGNVATAHAHSAPREEEAPEPPSASGQYPGPDWAQARGNGRSLSVGKETPDHLQVSLKEADYAEELGGVIAPQPAEAVTGVELTNEAIYRIVREVAESDSGSALYSATSADREFETAGHPAHLRRHFGLGFGLVLATQESGRLGRVLTLTQRREPQAFAEILGPEAAAVLALTNAPTVEQRLQPMGGEALWSPMWVERFVHLGALPGCQYAQNEEAIDGLFRPMLKIARGLGITSERGLAMMFDRVVARGPGGGLRWILSAAGPLRTTAQQAHAFTTLGYRDARDFQSHRRDLPQDGVLGPETYAALVAALREDLAATLPSPAEYVCRIIGAATGTARRRLLRLRDSAVLTDAIYQLP